MKHKKIVIITIIVVFVVTLAGCYTWGGEHMDGTISEVEMYKVGVIQFTENDALDYCREGFIRKLYINGIIEDENLDLNIIDVNENMQLFHETTKEFVKEEVDLIVSIGVPMEKGIFNEPLENDIPVLFVTGDAKDEDMELTGEITGINVKLDIENQISIVSKLLPEVKTLGILYSLGDPEIPLYIEEYKTLADKYNFKLIANEVHMENEVTNAISELLPQVDCIITPSDAIIENQLSIIIERATEELIPVVCAKNEQVSLGSIGAKGIDYSSVGMQIGETAAEILRGDSVASKIPIETIDDGILSVNNSVASKLGIKIPEDVSEKTGMVYQEIIIG